MNTLTGEPLTATEALYMFGRYLQFDTTRSPGGFEVVKSSANSCLRENFASKLVKELFSADERLTGNVRGVLRKKKYDEKIMAYVQELTFNSYPCPLTEKKPAWVKCT